MCCFFVVFVVNSLNWHNFFARARPQEARYKALEGVGLKASELLEPN